MYRMMNMLRPSGGPSNGGLRVVPSGPLVPQRSAGEKRVASARDLISAWVESEFQGSLSQIGVIIPTIDSVIRESVGSAVSPGVTHGAIHADHGRVSSSVSLDLGRDASRLEISVTLQGSKCVCVSTLRLFDCETRLKVYEVGDEGDPALNEFKMVLSRCVRAMLAVFVLRSCIEVAGLQCTVESSQTQLIMRMKLASSIALNLGFGDGAWVHRLLYEHYIVYPSKDGTPVAYASVGDFVGFLRDNTADKQLQTPRLGALLLELDLRLGCLLADGSNLGCRSPHGC